MAKGPLTTEFERICIRHFSACIHESQQEEDRKPQEESEEVGHPKQAKMSLHEPGEVRRRQEATVWKATVWGATVLQPTDLGSRHPLTAQSGGYSLGGYSASTHRIGIPPPKHPFERNTKEDPSR